MEFADGCLEEWLQDRKLYNDMYCRFKSRPTQDITAYYAGQIGKVSIEWNGEIYLRKQDRLNILKKQELRAEILVR